MIDTLLDLAPAWALAHAAPLLVVVPMLAAPFLVFVPSGRIAWLVAILATLASFVFALILLGDVQSTPGGVVSYALGGWEPPFGIEFRVDALNILILLIVTGIGFLAAVFSRPTVMAEIRHEKHPFFYSAYLVCFTGLCGVAITGDAFNLFVFL
ncbi:MAG: monovalent cation/H+ antiporter subunit D family protein, partial [Pseudomonadota bacterium]